LFETASKLTFRDKDNRSMLDNFSRRKVLLAAPLSLLTAMVGIHDLQASQPLRLVLVHGRGQQGLDPAQLKLAWLTAFRGGATANGRTVPDTLDVTFPYYGDVLDKFAREYDVPLSPQDVQARGGQINNEFLVFQAQVAEALQQRSGVTDAQVDAEYGANPKPKGPLNWEWVQAILRALDKYGFGISQGALEAFTRDVFLYTTRSGVRDEIDRIVAASLTDQPTIVVGHSLGSVVAYNVLRADPRTLQVPLFLTVGCPLGVRPIRDQLRPLRFPSPVSAWLNAFDTRDVVALYPLDDVNFPVHPAIENYPNVKNSTDNRHGIAGYLDDPFVAIRLLNALNT
jgi:hypothetical protein